MGFVLVCDCGSYNFAYDSEIGFTCEGCGEVYTEEEAGKHLIAQE